MSDYKDGLYITDGLDFASYLIERGATYVRSIWGSGGSMQWAFRASQDIEGFRSDWISRTEVPMCPRSFMETRTSLLSDIKSRQRNRP